MAWFMVSQDLYEPLPDGGRFTSDESSAVFIEAENYEAFKEEAKRRGLMQGYGSWTIRGPMTDRD